MILRSLSRVLREPDPTDGGGGTAVVDAPVLSPDQQKIAAAVAATATPDPAPKSASTRITKPIVGQTPPPNLLNVDFDMDPELVDTPTQKVDVKVVADAKKDDAAPKPDTKPIVKLDEKKADAAPKVVDDGLIRPKGTQQKAAPDARDYSGFNADEVATLKKMTNDAFNYAAPLLREAKTLKQAKQDSYLTHPQAYTLTPEYAQANRNVALADFEANHYKEQLLNIRAGRKWTVFNGFNDKNVPQYSEPQDATDTADINVSNALSQLMARSQEFTTARDNLTGTFQQRMNQEVANINQERARRFAWAADPKVLEDKVNVGGQIGEQTVGQIKQTFKGLFSPIHHSHPVMEVASDLFAALQIIGAENRELKAAADTKQVLKDDNAAAEINVESAANGSPKGGELVFDARGMDED